QAAFFGRADRRHHLLENDAPPPGDVSLRAGRSAERRIHRKTRCRAVGFRRRLDAHLQTASGNSDTLGSLSAVTLLAASGNDMPRARCQVCPWRQAVVSSLAPTEVVVTIGRRIEVDANEEDAVGAKRTPNVAHRGGGIAQVLEDRPRNDQIESTLRKRVGAN